MSQEFGGYTIEPMKHSLLPDVQYEDANEQQAYHTAYMAGRVIGSELFIHSMAAREVEQAHLLYEAEHDIVTTLPAERRFRRIAEAMIAEDLDAPWALGSIDLGNFKIANEHALGHARGDDVLRTCGITFKRATDLVARIGGDEFLFLVKLTNGGTRSSDPAVELEQVLAMVRAARSPVVARHTDMDKGNVRFYVSTAAIIYDARLSFDENKAKADQAMMATKADSATEYGKMRSVTNQDSIAKRCMALLKLIRYKL